MDEDKWILPGIGGELQQLYLETAQIRDLRFSWVAVTSLFSVIGSRRYRTQSKNYTSLSLMILAKSSSGKNHIIRFIEECLQQSGMSHLIRDPGGGASCAGLFGLLKKCPSQIIIRDEAGHSREAGKNNSHDISVRGALMSVVTNADGIFSLPTTSERSLRPSERESKREYERPIQSPGVTYIEISTGESLLKQVTPDEVASGELGRFIIITDDGTVPEMVATDPPAVDLPDTIRQYLSSLRYDPAHALTEEQAYTAARGELWKNWNAVVPELRDFTAPTEEDIRRKLAELKEDLSFQVNDPDDPDRAPVPVVFEWEDESLRTDVFVTRQRELMETYWQAGIMIHSKQIEHAMRLSLIYSLMDPETKEKRVISRTHASQALQLIDHIIEQVDRRIIPEIAHSDVMRAVQVAVEVIRSANGEPVSYDSWKTKTAWKNLDSSAKKLSVLDALTDHPIMAAKNPDTVRAGKFNRFLYIWHGEEDPVKFAQTWRESQPQREEVKTA